MALTAEQALAISKKYVKETVAGGGAIVGKNVTVSNVEPISGGNRITFSYTLDDGTGKETSIEVMNGINGADGADGISPTIAENADNTDDEYKLDIAGAFGTITTPNLKGEKGDSGAQGIRGEKGEQGSQGIQGLKGDKGDKGDDGYPFLIYKEYEQLEDFRKEDFPQVGLMFMIRKEGGAFPVYRYTGEGDEPYSFVTNLNSTETIKGDKGEQGEKGDTGANGLDGKDGTTYTPTIGTVTKGDAASASVVIKEDTQEAEFSFTLPKGDKGDTGAKGEKGDKGERGEQGATGAQGEKGDRGEQGRSIKKIYTDESNNVFATFTDEKTENIGKLDINVQADFLSDGGFGKLRYYNGLFQYYDTESGMWVDAAVSPQNPYILQMMPQEMQFIFCVYDNELKHYKLKWKEPDDTIIEGQAGVIVEKVIIRRKLNEVPKDIDDGELALELPRADFGNYEKDWYVDNGLTPKTDDVYYYKAFPMSTTGFYNKSAVNETKGIKAKDYVLYGFVLNQSESAPEHMISYIEDNEKFRSAKMNYETDTFDYGDWGDVFFIKNCKPCMLKYDGAVDYYLNPNDYSKKADGGNSDVSDEAYQGNAMVEIPKTYWKIVDNKDETCNVYISDKKIDEDFVCWSHIDNNGEEIPYCYMPCYNGSLVGEKLRSLSGKTPMHTKTAQQEVDYAKANNQSEDVIWYAEVYCDRVLINLLLLLIGKSTNTQTVFGQGYHSVGTQNSNPRMNTGTMDAKGLFYGKSVGTFGNGVKVFGIEHWWGNQWHRIAGWILDHATQKVKMTYGTSDGSEQEDYNFDGSGYIEIESSTPGGTNAGYTSKCIFTKNGIIPITASGAQTTYYTDGLWFATSQANAALVGGSSADGLLVGALCASLGAAASVAGWLLGAALSCKPLAQKG